MTSRAVWWRNGDALERFVGDLLAAELRRIRPDRSPPAMSGRSMRFEADAGIDSLERLKLATALAEAVRLERSGIDDNLLAEPTLGAWFDIVARGLDAYSAELIFRTSGSRGRPKWCPHLLAELEAEVDRLARLLPSGGRVMSAVPSHHIYGFLFTILLPARLDALTVDVRAQAPGALAGRLRAGDVVIGYPEFWSSFARTADGALRGVTGITSTAPCPPEVARGVTAAGLERLIEVYGSSETAGIGWRDAPEAAYALFDYWQRGDADDLLVRSLVSGARATVNVPDRLIWEDARHVRPAGRRDGAVQVGGTNVFPQHVRSVLEAHPEVASAAVRLMLPDEGERLKAFVVPREPDADVDALRRDLDSWLAARLSSSEQPKSIVFGALLPAGALGKDADWPAGPRWER